MALTTDLLFCFLKQVFWSCRCLRGKKSFSDFLAPSVSKKMRKNDKYKNYVGMVRSVFPTSPPFCTLTEMNGAAFFYIAFYSAIKNDWLSQQCLNQKDAGSVLGSTCLKILRTRINFNGALKLKGLCQLITSISGVALNFSRKK